MFRHCTHTMLGPSTLCCNTMFLVLFSIVYLSAICAQEFSVNFDPDILTVRTDETALLTVQIGAQNKKELSLRFSCQDQEICSVINGTKIVNVEENLKNVSVEIKGNFIGRSDLIAEISDLDTILRDNGTTAKVVVTRTAVSSKLSKIFTLLLTVLVVVNLFVVGTQLDLGIIFKVIKTPVGLVIGFCCQYLLMPCLAFGYANLFLNISSYQFGFFIVGCSPGGVMSNFWTVLFEGNIDLSVTMTFFSTLAAIGMLPMWIYTLGRFFYKGDVSIPFLNLAKPLIMVLLPFCAGLALIHFKPDKAPLFRKILKPFTLIVVILLIPFGIYDNLYVFKLIDWKILLCSCALPWTGYTISYLVAWLLRQSHKDARTIALEAGIQNTIIAILVCRLSLPEPDSDLTVVMPMCVFVVSTIPLWLLLIAFKCYNKGKTQPVEVEMDDVAPDEPKRVHHTDSGSGLMELDFEGKRVVIAN